MSPAPVATQRPRIESLAKEERHWSWASEEALNPKCVLPAVDPQESLDWPGRVVSPKAGRHGFAYLNRRVADEPVLIARPTSEHQSASTRDLLRTVRLAAELRQAQDELRRLKRQISELERQARAHDNARARPDLRELVSIHGVVVPARLNAAVSALEDSRALLDLGNDWDGDGTAGYSEETWGRAADLLVEIASILATYHEGFQIDVEILPGANGSLNIEWRTDGRELLITVPESPISEAQFYGDDGSGRNKFKGTLGTSKAVRTLSMWLAE